MIGLAKLYRNYARLEVLSIPQVLYSITGGYTYTIAKGTTLKQKDIWKQLRLASESGFLIIVKYADNKDERRCGEARIISKTVEMPERQVLMVTLRLTPEEQASMIVQDELLPLADLCGLFDSICIHCYIPNSERTSLAVPIDAEWTVLKLFGVCRGRLSSAYATCASIVLWSV
jgi:hypothetical protein